MQEVEPRKIVVYKTPAGETPFTHWFEEIKDGTIRNAIAERLKRVEKGNFGECDVIGEGVKELKFKGFGIRIYFAEVSWYIVLLLCSGDKASQSRDIKKAKKYWGEFKSRAGENS